MTDFTGKTILLTGATRGFGAKLTSLFWQAGANLLLVARHSDRLMDLHASLISSQKNQHVQIFPVDLADAKQVENFATELQAMRIDILINNAAIQGPIGLAWENDWQDWQETLQVNLLAPVALSRAVVSGMLKQKTGKIIHLSGGGSTQARPQFSAYAVAKAGLVRFSEILAEEVKAEQIDVNCIAPGMMKTELLEEIIQAGIAKAGEKEFQQAKNAEDNSEQAARLCLFLASPKSNGITGKLISAVWDPWERFSDYHDEIRNSDIYTLRRIVPGDRGKEWR